MLQRRPKTDLSGGASHLLRTEAQIGAKDGSRHISVRVNYVMIILTPDNAATTGTVIDWARRPTGCEPAEFANSDRAYMQHHLCKWSQLGKESPHGHQSEMRTCMISPPPRPTRTEHSCHEDRDRQSASSWAQLTSSQPAYHARRRSARNNRGRKQTAPLHHLHLAAETVGLAQH